MRPSPTRRPFVLLTAALLCAAAGLAQEGPAPRAVAPEPVWDAGTVGRGARLTHVFLLRNEGDAALEVREVRPTCGCTVADYDQTIPPGGEGRVTAVVDTATFRGAIAKDVTVFTNDAANPALRLTVKARVEPEVEATPGYARFLAVQGESPQALQQRLWATDGHPLRVLAVESPYPWVKVRWERAEDGQRDPAVAARQWLVTSTLAADAPEGPLAGDLVVLTDHPTRPRIEIPVTGYVRPVLQVSPPAADFGRFPADQPRKSSVLLTHHGEPPLEVTRVASDVDGLRVHTATREKGKLFDLVMTYEPGAHRGPFTGTITVHTSSPRMPTVEVPVRGEVQ